MRGILKAFFILSIILGYFSFVSGETAEDEDIPVIIIGDSYGQMSYGGFRDGQEVDIHSRNDADANCWTGRLSKKLELSDHLTRRIKSPQTNCYINIYDNCVIYSASGRGFISKVNNTDYCDMICELPAYINAEKVQLVVLGGGANDSKWPNAEKMRTMTTELIVTAHNLYPNARIVIAQLGWGKYAEGTLPEDYYSTSTWDDKIQKGAVLIDSYLEEICTGYDYLTYAGNVGKDALAGHEDEYFTGYVNASGQYDVIHPNYCGEEALAELLYQRLVESDISQVCENSLGHNWSQWQTGSLPNCTEAGYEFRTCSRCKKKDVNEIPSIEHDFGPWIYDGESYKTHSHVCKNDSSHIETEKCYFYDDSINGFVITYKCSICDGTYSETIYYNPDIRNITRIYGDNRYSTSIAIADTYLDNSGKDKYDCIILATGEGFADALSGSYLSAVINAPILITKSGKETSINKYINEHLKKDGTVYVLGGTAALSEELLVGLNDFNIVRLQGANRYDTNLAILNEAGVNSDTIIVATGLDYADSLSASATGLPILLVNGTGNLNSKQISFIKSCPNIKFIIVGGTAAVSSDIETRLNEYGEVKRIYGENRMETSVEIARYFFPDSDTAVLAYGKDYPDGLCGGPLAYQACAPLILTTKGKTFIAKRYIKSHNIQSGYALGGSAVLPESSIRKVFGAGSEIIINEIHR